MNNEKFHSLLIDFKSLPVKRQSESIFNIAGYPHYENVCSNILAFYLNPQNEHGLGNLFLTSLLSLNNEKLLPYHAIEVAREVSTNNHGRIDIVITTNNQIIGIENKIYHHLANDLEDYSETINKWANTNTHKTKIVLSLKKENVYSGFIAVTYKEYWSAIRERLGNYTNTTSQKWLLYLIDFMTTIDKLIGENMEWDETDQFIIDNENIVTDLVNRRNEFYGKLNRTILDLKSKVEVPKGCNQWIYAKTCLVHDFKLNDYSISFDLYISTNGWKLQLFGRDSDSRNYLKTLIPKIQHNEKQFISDGDRYTMNEKYELKKSLDEIRSDLESWFKRLLDSTKE